MLKKIFLMIFVFFDDTFEGEWYLFTAFYDLFPQEFVFNPGIFEPHEHGIFLIDSLYFTTFDLLKNVGTVLIIVGQCFVLELIVLDVYDLL